MEPPADADRPVHPPAPADQPAPGEPAGSSAPSVPGRSTGSARDGGSRRERRVRERREQAPIDVDVLVVGAGQAGLAAAYHLRRAGLAAVGEPGWQQAAATFVVLDDEPGPGGAWQHRWPWLSMADAHGVHELPGMPLVPGPADEPAAQAVPYYFAQYEDAFALHVLRPVRVLAVADDEPARRGRGRLVVTSSSAGPGAGGDAGRAETVTWRARGLVSATGTWRRPFWPAYPGRAEFGGRQLHSADYRTAAELADGHVVVVGGGTSAVQLLLQVAHVTTTTWVTRRPPAWRDAPFTPELGREAVAEVDARTRAGQPPGSVVSATGLPLTPEHRAAIASGVLRRRPMFERLTPTGVRWADGQELAARTVLWCTGFRPSVGHLAPLGLRGPEGGIVMAGTQVVADPRVQLVGYGPSASTVGANRAGREAVANLRALLEL